MATLLDDDLLTTAEAADLLKVSQVTIGRWIKRGRLPAYHLGPRKLRVRRADLAALLSPICDATNLATVDVKMSTNRASLADIKPLTDEEIEEALEWLREARELRERQRARHGGPLPSSWRLIRE